MGVGRQSPARRQRNRVRRRRRTRATVVISGDSATLHTPVRFAPSVETCRIRYAFVRERPGSPIEIIIKDKDGTELKRNVFTFLSLRDGPGNGSGVWQWDGKDDGGNYATPLQSPLSVQFRHASGVAVTRNVNIEVGLIALWADAYRHGEDEEDSCKLWMNDPDHKTTVVATVYLKRTNGRDVRTRVPIDVSFSFEDPAPANTVKNSSFKYQTGPDKFLSKQGDNAAIHWEADNNWTTSSSDGFKTKCKVSVNTNNGANLAKAKAFFKSSGVGGDNFKIKATVFASDGTTVIRSRRGSVLTVWGNISFTGVYTMSGENYIDAATEHPEIRPAFETRAYVKYSRGAVNTLAENLTVKYIGLYDVAKPNKQKVWPSDLSPRKLEATPYLLRPTVQELADYSGIDITKKAIAKTAIEAKAQLWFNAIVDDYNVCVSDWFAAVNMTGGSSLLAVQYYHPKLSGVSSLDADNNAIFDGRTNFWPAGISINLANPGSGLNTPDDPDKPTWRAVQGFNTGNASVVFKNYGTATRLQIVCRHEIGHATKRTFNEVDTSRFLRARFGVGDHSASGLMTPSASSNAFSNRDVRILRGIVP